MGRVAHHLDGVITFLTASVPGRWQVDRGDCLGRVFLVEFIAKEPPAENSHRSSAPWGVLVDGNTVEMRDAKGNKVGEAHVSVLPLFEKIVDAVNSKETP